MKRSAPSTSSQPAAKRTGKLNSYFVVPPPKDPEPLVHSSPITDRQSTFVAHATTVTSKHAATQFHSYVRDLRSQNHPSEADHEMLGWRTMSLRVGKSGLGGPEDWIVSEGHDNDGENNGGMTVAKAILEEGGVDIAVVVSRYYGGIMLGPARFTHIRQCAIEAVRLLESALALPGLLKRLKELDEEIGMMTSPTKPPDYEGMTVEKAERLVKAKEKRLEFLAAREEKLILEAVEKETAEMEVRKAAVGREKEDKREVEVVEDEFVEPVAEDGDESEPAPEEEYLPRFDEDGDSKS